MIPPKRPSSRLNPKKPPAIPTANQTSNQEERGFYKREEESLSSQSLAKFMTDFNRMKLKMNVLLSTQKEQEEKIVTL